MTPSSRRIFRQQPQPLEGGCVAEVCCHPRNIGNRRQQACFSRVLPSIVAAWHTRQHTATPLLRRGLPVALPTVRVWEVRNVR